MPTRQRQKNAISIMPPIGGVVRKTGFQSHPPFTAYKAENWWPIDVDSGRSIVAVRPALSNYPAPGKDVNLISPINGFATGKPFQSLIAASDGNLFWWDGDFWNLAQGDLAQEIDTGRPVFSQPFLQQSFICSEDRPILVFDYPSGYVTEMEAEAGEAPTNVRFAAVFQGSLWVSGKEEFPHIIYASRTGNAYDWEFSAPLSDYGGAFASAGEDEGLLNGPITAMWTHTSDTMIVSTVEGLFALRGHPRRGGVFEQVSGKTYVLGQGAWCKTPGDVSFFMTTLGLMMLPPEPGAVPVLISNTKIPDELIGLSYTYNEPTICMEYSSRWNIIYITDRQSEQAWVYDMNANGFWEMTEVDFPWILHEHKPFLTADKCGVLWGRKEVV